jgi:hypothetical protein
VKFDCNYTGVSPEYIIITVVPALECCEPLYVQRKEQRKREWGPSSITPFLVHQRH